MRMYNCWPFTSKRVLALDTREPDKKQNRTRGEKKNKHTHTHTHTHTHKKESESENSGKAVGNEIRCKDG